ncbi:hypothetical protein BH20ACT2_BH20ACT2_13520 [soil metagenome]
MRIAHIDLSQFRGISDKVVGLGKELTGTLLGRDGLQEAGQAQQERGTKELEALKAEAEAQKERAEAKTQEARQRSAQKTKDQANA